MQERNDTGRPKPRRRGLTLLTSLLLGTTLAAALLGGVIVGCGSGDDDDDGGTITDPSRATGTFFGPEPPPFTGPKGLTRLGRTFVKLQNGVPQSLGFELYEEGRDAQPPTAITDEAPNVYFLALPPEANMTCFKQMGVFYFTGHPIDQYRPNGEPEHMHGVFLLSPPAQPLPGQAAELETPRPEEIPTGISRGVPDVVVPGVGVSYDNPIKPVGQPARITIGHNYLYYNGHMNGMVVGQNSSFLRNKELETDEIPQPQLYPRSAWYPTRWTIRYDEERKVNVYEVSDFIFIGPDKVTTTRAK